MNKHTPTPWKVALPVGNEPFVSNEGYVVVNKVGRMTDYERAKLDADFIVRAVNSHEALILALKKMLAYSDSRCADGSRTAMEASLADEVSDLIAEAEGK